MIEFLNRMENLVIESTTQSPKINFNTNGELSISGVSTVSHPQRFYSVLIDWIQQFKNSKPKQISLSFEVYYLNTASSLIFVELLRLVQSFASDETSVSIIWRYEEDDEDILMFGQEMATVTGSDLDFVLI